MKIYVYASKVDVDTSLFKGSPFSCHTGVSYYDDFLTNDELKYKQDAKNRTGKIVMMSPEEYYSECSKHLWSGNYSVDHIKKSRRYDSKVLEKYKKDIQRGVKYFMPYINYADNCQEGLHRMMVMGDLFGWDTKFPVLVVEVYDKERERQHELHQEYHYFRHHAFSKLCEDAMRDVSSGKSTPPDNIEELLKNQIFENAEFFDVNPQDFDVEVEFENSDEDPVVRVYLTRYGEYTVNQLSEPENFWVENYFYGDTADSTDTATSQLSNHIDFDDIDLDSLLFL